MLSERSSRSWSARRARIDDDVGLEVEDLLELLQRHVEQRADARRQALQEPDVRDRRGEVDVAHALAPDLRLDDLDAALLAHDAAVPHALVLAAVALVVLRRPEDLGAEEPVALRLEGPVVDGLRLLHLAVRPRPDLVRRRERDADRVEVERVLRLLEETEEIFHHRVRPLVAAGSRLVLLLDELDVERQALELLHHDVEGLGQARLEHVLALDDRLVHARAAGHVVGLDGEHLLERVGGAVGLERPHLHLAEPLAAELRLAAERLLRDERVRARRAGVDLVVDQVVELHHVHDADRHLVREGLAGAAVEEAGLAGGRAARRWRGA